MFGPNEAGPLLGGASQPPATGEAKGYGGAALFATRAAAADTAGPSAAPPAATMNQAKLPSQNNSTPGFCEIFCTIFCGCLMALGDVAEAQNRRNYHQDTQSLSKYDYRRS